MSKLFSNGCSFLSTRPKDGVNTFVTKILAEQYNLQLFNLAMGGRGNDRISFTTKLWFEQNGTNNTFAVIGWSSTYRNDYITNDEWKKEQFPNMDLTWRTWKVGDKPFDGKFITKNKGWDIEKTTTMRFLDHVFDLQNYFKLKKIPYVMYNALPNDFETNADDFKKIKESIDFTRFFKPETSHYDFIRNHKPYVVSLMDPHPSAEGHSEWAKQLKEFIDVNNLRTI